MVDKEETKKVREEEGQWAAIKHALGQGKKEIDEEVGLSDTYNEAKETGKRKAADNPVSVTCHACTSELDSADVERCPHCGYDADFGSQRLMWSLVTGVLVFTVIGIPIAIFTYRKAQKYRKKEKRGVTKKNWS